MITKPFLTDIQTQRYAWSNTDVCIITDKRYILAIRNRMIEIPKNFPSNNRNNDEKCRKCGDIETTKHLYIFVI